MSDWQPIETHDGSVAPVDLWAYWPEHEKWSRSADAVWIPETKDWQLGTFSASQYLYPPTITHWMLPPEPPQP